MMQLQTLPSITTLEQATHGESSIQIQANTGSAFAFDVNEALDRDLLSQGAKDFIERLAGTDGVGASEVFTSVNNLTAGTTNGTLTANGETAAGTTAIDVNSGGVGGVATVDFAANSASTATVILDLYNNATIANATESFRETITINVTQAGASGNNIKVAGTGRTEQVAAVTTMTGTSAGEALTMSLTDRSKFADLNTYMDANASGSFALFGVTAAPAGGAASTMRMLTLIPLTLILLIPQKKVS